MKLSSTLSKAEFASGVILAEALTLGQVAASAALGLAISRGDIYIGDCALNSSDSAWCNAVPSAHNLILGATTGALPCSALVSGVTLKYLSSDLPLRPIIAPVVAAVAMNTVLLPFVYAPLGAVVGAHFYDVGGQSARAALSGLYGGLILMAITVGVGTAIYTSVKCSGVLKTHRRFDALGRVASPHNVSMSALNA